MAPSTDEAAAVKLEEGSKPAAGLPSGRQIDQVVLNIDYRIIEHFSRNLYSSENKAIEELVSNGFDALAEHVYIYVPGEFTKDHLIVWDDGEGMDVDGLKGLWVIASSPKQDHRIRRGPDDRKRKVIGKFGIGKLASYTVGNRILHLCRDGDRFLLVSVDYAAIHGDEGHRPPDLEDPLKEPILLVEEADAREFIANLFVDETEPAALELFDAPHWTLAVVSDLKVDNIAQGRLSWVLGNGMPLRPDFRVWVDDEEVTPKAEKGAVRDWEFDEEKLQTSVRSQWKGALKDGAVAGEVQFGAEVGLDPSRPEAAIPYVSFPNLGKVWGRVRLFDRSLKKGRAADQGRSQGFFIMVLGRLINPRDDTFLLPPPSYGTFNRSQFVINADELDRDLLADRGGVHEGTPRVEELRVLQSALYGAARTELERMEEEGETGDLRSILPTGSRLQFRQPLMALLTGSQDGVPDGFDVSNPAINRTPVGEDERVARIAPDGSGFEVNTSHPFFNALKSRVGGGAKANKAFDRWYNLLAVSDLLFEGHLYDAGLPPDQIEQFMAWRDRLFRDMAVSFESSSSDLLDDLHNASFKGDAEFENAIARVLRAMGFDAERKGGSGDEDVRFVATLGPESYTLSFEAKGSKDPVSNDRATVSAAANHRDAAGAEHAVILAREFTGFARDPGNEDAAILGQCRSTPGVSIMTTEALSELFEVVQEYAYPLHLVKTIFTDLEPPASKLERIRDLARPTEDFNLRLLLEDIWELQQGTAANDLVPYRTVWQQRPEWRDRLTFEEFQAKVLAFEKLAAGLIRLTGENVFLVQDPDHIADRIVANLQRRAEESEEGMADQQT